MSQYLIERINCEGRTSLVCAVLANDEAHAKRIAEQLSYLYYGRLRGRYEDSVQYDGFVVGVKLIN